VERFSYYLDSGVKIFFPEPNIEFERLDFSYEFYFATAPTLYSKVLN